MERRDRKIQLEKRAIIFIKQQATRWEEINLSDVPENGGVFLISYQEEKTEIPLYLNHCSNLREELASQRMMQEMLILNHNLVWLKRIKPEIMDRETVKNGMVKLFCCQNSINIQTMLTNIL